MTLAWMLYTLLVGTLLALTARGFEEVCRVAARPSRWVWTGALVLVAVLAGLAPRRAMSPLLPVSAMTADAEPDKPVSDFSARTGADLSGAQSGLSSLSELQHTVAAAWEHIPPSVNRYLAMLWGSLSVLALLFLTAMYVRFRRVRRDWPVAELQGVRVRIAVDGGPAVIGLVQPEIVVPHWLLGLSPAEQRIVLAHEREHLRARDPLLLAVGCLVVALLPWHPAVWWMFSRLRLAVELDCDMRVLHQGVAPRLYGTLLIDMAERCSGFPIPAPALADKASHLQQRLLAMKPLRRRFARARGSIFGTFALLSLLAACATQVPVAAAQVSAGPTGACPSTPTTGTSMQWEGEGDNNKLSGKLVIIGRCTLTNDGKDLATLSPRGSFVIEERAKSKIRRVEIRADATGTMTRTWFVDSTARPYDDEARAWLAAALNSQQIFNMVAAQSQAPPITRDPILLVNGTRQTGKPRIDGESSMMMLNEKQAAARFGAEGVERGVMAITNGPGRGADKPVFSTDDTTKPDSSSTGADSIQADTTASKKP